MSETGKPVPQPERTKQVPRQFEIIENSVHRLEEEVNELNLRLSSVCTEEPPMTDSEPDEPLIPMASAIAALRRRIDHVNVRIAGIIERTEL